MGSKWGLANSMSDDRIFLSRKALSEFIALPAYEKVRAKEPV
jgi:hypothetical protein